jgi:polyferredoxin
MDTNIIYRLILIGIALVAIGIGAVMTYLGNYLAAPEQKKQSSAKFIRLYGVIFVILSFAYLIYSMFALRG